MPASRGAEDGWCQLSADLPGESYGLGAAVRRIEVVRRSAEAGVVFDGAAEFAGRCLDWCIGEGRVEDEGFGVGREPDRAVDVGLDVVVERVEPGSVGQPAQVRQDVL